MSSFETNPKRLKSLLAAIDERELALPDFQRSFVWDPNATELLLESIASGFPAGSLLFIKHRDDLFAIREFEEAPKLNGRPHAVVLDGQQRLTSLYQALTGRGDFRYFISMEPLLEDDIEEAVFHESLARVARRNLDDRDTQARDLILPMSRLMETNGFGKWRDEVLQLRGSDKGLGDQLWAVHDRWLKNIEEYEFPVVTLSETTPLEAVCNIFETLNSTGVRLTVFELLTARFWPHGIDLRGLWDEAKTRFDVLDDFGVDPYYLLQMVALRAEKKACTRSVVLDLTPTDMRVHWEIVAAGTAGALTFLKEECGVVRGRWLPYEPMLIPLGAIWTDKVDGVPGPSQITRKDKISKWYWCSTLGQVYENQTNTRASQDHKAIPAWLEGGSAPPAVASFKFEHDLRNITHRQRALYRTLIGLLVRQGARDFHSGDLLTWDRVHDDQINDHHIFPQAYLRDLESPVEAKLRDSVLNRALIDKITNIRIGKRPPSDYLQEIADEVGDVRLDSILKSHMLPVGGSSALRTDDFEGFLIAREAALRDAVADVTAPSF